MSTLSVGIMVNELSMAGPSDLPPSVGPGGQICMMLNTKQPGGGIVWLHGTMEEFQGFIRQIEGKLALLREQEQREDLEKALAQMANGQPAQIILTPADIVSLKDRPGVELEWSSEPPPVSWDGEEVQA